MTIPGWMIIIEDANGVIQVGAGAAATGDILPVTKFSFAILKARLF
jgi:hypothetical protein